MVWIYAKPTCLRTGMIPFPLLPSSPRVACRRANGQSAPPRQRPGLSRKKVVDVFRLHVLPWARFNEEIRQELSRELTDMIRLLESQDIQKVRHYVNRKLVETLEQRQASARVRPVEIFFDNALSARETVVDIRGVDSPAFLYAFTNALTMRGLYLSKATIKGNRHTGS